MVRPQVKVNACSYNSNQQNRRKHLINNNHNFSVAEPDSETAAIAAVTAEVVQMVNATEALLESRADGEAAGEEPYDSDDDDESDNSEPADDSEESRSHDTEEDEHREYAEERVDRHNSREDENHIASPQNGRRRPIDAVVQEAEQEPEDADTREEITESDDGSASDSGRSIASSVSTERFFQVNLSPLIYV